MTTFVSESKEAFIDSMEESYSFRFNQLINADEFAKTYHINEQLEELANRIRTMATVRVIGDVSLYPGYDTDDAYEIAQELYKRQCSSANDMY